MNVILQPVHLLLYMSLVGAASDLVAKNPIYALVAIGFLIPAEKFIKRMFGLDKASSTSDMGSFAKNALAYEGLKKIGSAFSGKGGKSSKGIKGASSSSQDSEEHTFNKIRRAELGAYAANMGDESENQNENITMDNNENLDQLEQQRNRFAELNEREQKNGVDIENDQIAQNRQRRIEELNREIELERARQEQLSLQQDQQNQEQGRQRSNIQENIGSSDKSKPGKGKRIAIRAGRTLAKGIYKGTKIAGKTALTVGGAAIGLASAIGTGDALNAFKYTPAGAMAGSQIGKGVFNLGENLASNGVQTVRDTYDSVLDNYNDKTYGSSKAKEMRDERLNKRERNRFLSDENEIKKYKKMRRDIGYEGDVQTLMNAAADYKEAGVSDDMIKNALKVENKRDHTVGGANHEKMIDVASLATENGYKKSDLLDNKSRSNMEDVVQAKIAEKDRYEVMKNIADLYGVGDVYSKKSRFKKPTSNNT